MPVVTISPYCTGTHIARRVGSIGVALRVDDDSDSLASVIEEASIEVYGYVGLFYSDAALVGSSWIRKKTTDIAVYYLCQRRLNQVPKSALTAYEKAIADLEKVQSGIFKIPDAAERKASVPQLIGQRIEMRPWPRTVTELSRSTGKQEGYVPRNDWADWYDYYLW